MRVLPALTDSLGHRWAWCGACLAGHDVGRLVLRFCDEAEVRWPCPDPDAPAAIRVRAEAWSLFNDEKGT